MAVYNGLDFAIAYACVLALFSYLTFVFVPAIARAAYDALVVWIESSQDAAPSSDRTSRGQALLGGAGSEG
jgi:hypothetical protein